MSTVNIELFDDEGEIISLEEDGGHTLSLIIKGATEGLAELGGVTKRLTEGKCSFDLRALPDGELSLRLILENKAINLPTLNKNGRLITPTECKSDYLRAVSIRERRLEKSLSHLKKELEILKKKVYGSSIF